MGRTTIPKCTYCNEKLEEPRYSELIKKRSSSMYSYKYVLCDCGNVMIGKFTSITGKLKSVEATPEDDDKETREMMEEAKSLFKEAGIQLGVPCISRDNQEDDEEDEDYEEEDEDYDEEDEDNKLKEDNPDKENKVETSNPSSIVTNDEIKKDLSSHIRTTRIMMRGLKRLLIVLGTDEDWEVK